MPRVLFRGDRLAAMPLRVLWSESGGDLELVWCSEPGPSQRLRWPARTSGDIPAGVARWAIEQTGGDLVCDPFARGCGVALACVALRRRCIVGAASMADADRMARAVELAAKRRDAPRAEAPVASAPLAAKPPRLPRSVVVPMWELAGIKREISQIKSTLALIGEAAAEIIADAAESGDI